MPPSAVHGQHGRHRRDGQATGATGSTGATGPTGAPSVANPSISLNWAGYAISGGSAVVRHFKHVSGSWVAPAVDLHPGIDDLLGVLGGAGRTLAERSTGLEQTGTEADCDANGVAHYSAWYELVPAGPVTLKLAIAVGRQHQRRRHGGRHQGDDPPGRQHQRRFGRQASPSGPPRYHLRRMDRRSAIDLRRESGSCTALPLTDFGTVAFSNASARTARGMAGTISNSKWVAQPIALDELSQPGIGDRFFGPATLVTAVPTILEDAGSSFAVNWAESSPTYGPGGGSPGRHFPGFGA